MVHREEITAGPPAQEEGWRDEGASPLLCSARIQPLTVVEKPLAGFFFFHNLQQIEHVPFSC